MAVTTPSFYRLPRYYCEIFSIFQEKGWSFNAWLTFKLLCLGHVNNCSQLCLKIFSPLIRVTLCLQSVTTEVGNVYSIWSYECGWDFRNSLFQISTLLYFFLFLNFMSNWGKGLNLNTFLYGFIFANHCALDFFIFPIWARANKD